MKPILPREMATNLEDRLHERHGHRLGTARIRLEGWRTGDKIIVKGTLARPDKTLHYPMEAGVLLEKGTREEIDEAVALAVDFLAYYVEQYLDSDGEVLLPLDWKAISFGDREVFAKGWERNLALEEAADSWLAGDHERVASLLGDRKR